MIQRINLDKTVIIMQLIKMENALITEVIISIQTNINHRSRH